jgi:hypothetical protein
MWEGMFWRFISGILYIFLSLHLFGFGSLDFA